MKPKWLLAALLLLATVAVFWFLKPTTKKADALGRDAYALTEKILAIGPRPPQSEGLDKVRALLKNELEAAGWKVSIQEFERDTAIGRVRFANLRARFSPSGDPWKSNNIKGLLCAHIDSKLYKDREFLGADDAASSCAAVVEIGKYLAQNKPAMAEQLELVLFDGEEAFTNSITTMDGLYGSRFYANSWRGSETKPKFGILLDMIGHKDLSIAIPSDSPKHLAKLMFSVAKKNGVAKHFDTAPGAIQDDHVPLNFVGIPTIDIIGDFSSKAWWHTPADNISIISEESLAISIGVVLGMLDELLPE